MHTYSLLWGLLCWQLIFTPKVSSITAYDCLHEEALIDQLDLANTHTCPETVAEYANKDQVRVQIVQTDSDFPIEATNCKISITRVITRCGGIESYTYGTHTPVWEQDYELTPQECRNAILKEEVQVNSQKFKIEKQGVVTHTFYSHGNLGQDGTCTFGFFTRAGKAYERSYEETRITISMRTIQGIGDKSTGIVVFANGLRARIQDEVMRDSQEGTMVWTSKEPSCLESVSQIYQGEATLHEKIKETLTGSILIIQSKDTQQYAGMVIKEPITMCNVACYNTHLKGIVVCILRPYQEAIPRTSLLKHYEQDTIQLYAQLGYTHLTTNLHVSKQFHKIQRDMCTLETKTIYNKLQALAGVHNKYALLDIYGKGHQVMVMGAVAYITKCVPVEVTKFTHTNCTIEIPVLYNGKKHYADPLTWTLSTIPTIIPCSSIMPNKWLINKVWFCCYPEAKRCGSPGKLDMDLPGYGPYPNFAEGLGLGLFSPEQQAIHRQYNVIMTSRDASVNKLTTVVTRNARTEGDLGSPVSKFDLENIKKQIIEAVFPMVRWLGETWPMVAGILLLGSLTYAFFMSIARIFIVLRQRGFGWWLPLAAFSTFFNMVVLPLTIARAAARTATDNMQHFQPTALETQQLEDTKNRKEIAEQLEQLRREQDRLDIRLHTIPSAPPEVVVQGNSEPRA